MKLETQIYTLHVSTRIHTPYHTTHVQVANQIVNGVKDKAVGIEVIKGVTAEEQFVKVRVCTCTCTCTQPCT